MAETIPWCAPPKPNPRPPGIEIPPGSCDTHAHIFGSGKTFPYLPNRTYTPPEASLAQYLALHRVLGIERGVLVQPSVYGTDNRYHLEGLRQLRQQGLEYRGVCVVSPDVTEPELDQLDQAGFCGVRMNLLFKGGIGWDAVTHLANRIARRGWHLQFLIDVSDALPILDRIAELPVPVVIDHMGHMRCSKGIDHPGFQRLLSLLAASQVWVKLSGSYRISVEQQPPYNDVTAFARALVDANSHRCLWGSDWPHPHFQGAMPDDGDLLDLLAAWVPGADDRHRILVANPARLYGFSPAP